MKRLLFAMAALAGLFAGSAIAQEFTMKVGYVNRADELHPAWAGLLKMEEHIETASNGRIDVRMFPDGQLGKGQAMLEQTRAGAIQMSYANDGNINQVFPSLQVMSIPYLFVSRQVAHELLDGPIGRQLMDQMAEETGLRVLAWSENGGFRHFTNNVRPIRTPKDMEGLKIRVQNIPLHVAMVESLGASPTPIAWKELYTSLQTGVVDGQENPINTFRIPRLEEVQDYMILDGHVYAISAGVFNEDWLNELPPELRKVVTDGVMLAQKTTRDLILEYEDESLQYLKDYGLEIHDPTPQEKAMFREATRDPAIMWLRENLENPDLIDAVVAEAKAINQNRYEY